MLQVSPKDVLYHANRYNKHQLLSLWQLGIQAHSRVTVGSSLHSQISKFATLIIQLTWGRRLQSVSHKPQGVTANRCHAVTRSRQMTSE